LQASACSWTGVSVNRFGDKMTTKGEKIASRFRRGPTAALMTGRPDPDHRGE
jgi:hypothetical protein